MTIMVVPPPANEAPVITITSPTVAPSVALEIQQGDDRHLHRHGRRCGGRRPELGYRVACRRWTCGSRPVSSFTYTAPMAERSALHHGAGHRQRGYRGHRLHPGDGLLGRRLRGRSDLDGGLAPEPPAVAPRGPRKPHSAPARRAVHAVQGAHGAPPRSRSPAGPGRVTATGSGAVAPAEKRRLCSRAPRWCSAGAG